MAERQKGADMPHVGLDASLGKFFTAAPFGGLCVNIKLVLPDMRKLKLSDF
jgi:hypothetical protein